ncbi:MAG: PDZ domain-containing protein [Candidatus Brocadiaceae bacterium]|uniref:PDZ domain-containing protein n=1 Tax=Candidatus Wunengus sp. YC61 TaxID=3367698 RepID=UPI00271709CA|nr:PDZ domain-containing protein [Candidatus Brocadiaceae bacterium]
MLIDISKGLKKYIPIILMMFLLASCVSLPSREQYINADYGSYPENYEQRIKDYFSNILRDPYSAQYRFHKPFKGWIYKAPIQGGGVDHFGWLVRVWVNAKNAFGGYIGEKHYMFFFKNGIMRETGYLSSSWESYFPDPQETSDYKERIGMLIDSEGYILDVEENSPASKAGILRGDKLIKVNEQNVQAESTQNIVNMIRSTQGIKIQMTVLRNNQEFSLEVERTLPTAKDLEVK